MTHGWNIYELRGENEALPTVFVLVPLKDTKLHTFEHCWCDPDPVAKDGYIMVSHHAHDGRE